MFHSRGVRVGHILALIVFAAIASYASAIQCELDTCPPGPIFIFFAGQNCTGAKTYYTTNLGFDTCWSYVSDSVMSRNLGTYVETLRYYNSTNCGANSSDALVVWGESYYFGACNPNLGRRRKSDLAAPTYMILNNITDSYVSPQPFILDTSIPLEPSRLQVDCANRTDCQSKGEVIYFQSFPNNTCAAGDSAYQVETSYKPNTCYYDGSFSYVMKQCYSPYATQETYYADSACTRPVYSVIDASFCGYSYVPVNSYCTVRANPTGAQPTASASSFNPLVYSTILLCIFSILL